MANLSNVINGKMTLEGEWTAEMVKNLNTIAQEWGRWTYGTYMDGDFAEDCRTVPFDATGRWEYETNLTNIGVWTRESERDNVRNAYEKLCGELAGKTDADGERTAWLTISFKEDEPGCQILRECDGEIYLCDDNLKGFIIFETSYDYTAGNLVELGFYESLEEIYELELFEREDA